MEEQAGRITSGRPTFCISSIRAHVQIKHEVAGVKSCMQFLNGKERKDPAGSGIQGA